MTNGNRVSEEIIRGEDGSEKAKIVISFSSPVCGEVFVKVHAMRTFDFGSIKWRMSGSHCDADGKALAWGEGHKIHPVQHVVEIQSSSREDIKARFDEGVEVIAERLLIAIENEATQTPLSLA